MAGAINQYDGTILFERVLKSNLPTKASGKRIFFVVNNPTDTVGEIWATNKDGGLVCYSMAMNLEEVIQLLGNVQQAITDMKNGSKSGSLQQQINNLIDGHIVTDFNDIPNTERFIKSGVNASNAPSIAQFVGIRALWDSNFSFTIGTDIEGKFYVRQSKGKWEEIALDSNGFNGRGSNFGGTIADMNLLTTPMVAHTVINTSNIANFPPVTLGPTRLTIKIYYESYVMDRGMLVQEVWLWEGAAGKCGYRRNCISLEYFSDWFKIGG